MKGKSGGEQTAKEFVVYSFFEKILENFPFILIFRLTQILHGDMMTHNKKRRMYGFSLDPDLCIEIKCKIGSQSFSRVVEECMRHYFPIYEALHLKGTRPLECIEKRNEYQIEDLTKAMTEAFRQALKQHFEHGGSKHE